MDNAKVNIKASMGGYGGIVKSTSTTVGNFCCIKALEDTVVTAVGNVAGLTSVTLLGGDWVIGEFTSVTVTSGKVILYYNIDGES